ncbi:Uu.00g059820.m01.CDS01 [Anthostomella pinea]|uniref:Uu.00g059820.m01.CDS01 n=1 Tax=Anthostomella pinea TaxID=933095 RepID=A0AAI8YMD0_9PEZI|nr:Uu.00g059820.m01.CDS01 [Anthostomella pinea]
MATNGTPSGSAQFSSLSTELCLHIWSFVAPEVHHGRAAQVFALQLIIPNATETQAWGADVPPYHVRPGHVLKDQTAGLRTMLAVHRESRDEALRFFPDTLAVDEKGGIVRYNSEHDMVFLDGKFNAHWMERSWDYHLAGFTDSIQHLGLGPDLLKFLTFFVWDLSKPVNPIWYLMRFLRPFNALDVVYYAIEESRHATHHALRWPAPDKMHRHLQVFSKAAVKPAEPSSVMYCWPDLIENEYYARNEGTFFEGGEDGIDEFGILVETLCDPSGWSDEIKKAFESSATHTWMKMICCH